ncbi:MAG TPA: glycosyltransferase family A protein [Dyella sp.]|uniref:glycosyltransferase n=1 Tax=Dyella sp. TaxID=1869338 RepID=UPI002F9560D7
MDQAAFDIRRRAVHVRPGSRPKAIVAMPVCNEADSLVPAMLALGAQNDLHGRAFHDVLVVVVLNGCTDASWDRLQSLRNAQAPAWIGIDGELPVALRHAGGARRVALTTALGLATDDTDLIATTDADSTVSTTWVARQLAWMHRGCDVILGAPEVALDSTHAWPRELIQRHRRECCYARWLGRIDAWMDPCDYDPWPRHGTPSGASLGFRPTALRAAFPLPAPAVGEDRALVQRCHALDLKIRGDAQIRVTTSGRLHGRARHGMADTLAHWIRNPGAPCDSMLEPVTRAITRVRWRIRLRERRRQGHISAAWLARALAISPREADRIVAMPTFGLFWQACQQSSARLTPVRLNPSALDQEIRTATEWLRIHTPHTYLSSYLDSEPAIVEIPA